MAGLSCAQSLVATGRNVELFDKGRGPGGRMSTRRVEVEGRTISFDHGAQYLTARDPDFRTQVNAWETAGVTAPWPIAGPDAWVGVPGMNAPVRAMAQNLPVNWTVRIQALEYIGGAWRLHREDGAMHGPYPQLVVALPAEQAAELLAPIAPALARLAAGAVSDPCWTWMALFASPLALPDILRDQGMIGWAARNGTKPGRGGDESWVVQASPDWSRANLELTADAAAARLAEAFAALSASPLPEIIWSAAHRWRYARSAAIGLDACWDAQMGIGLCGDWLIGPRVEAAWRSGALLARRMCP